MREIKFRGKDCWGNWRYGDLMKNSIPTASPVIVEDFYYDDPDDSMFEVNPDTVGQFTGLKDCEGQEIYEGDIVRWTEGDEENALVVWRAGEFDVDLRTGPCCIGALACLNPFDDDGPRLTVIGNIHDNPGLLR